MKKACVFLFLLVITLITFANGLRNEFCIDDHAFFDEKMRNIKYLPLQFIPDKNKALQLGDQRADAYYRPLAHVVPMLANIVFPDNTVGLHAVNIVLMSCAGFMIFLLVWQLSQQWWLGLLTALFYIVHPINGVMVNYITASVFSVQVICMSASLLLFLGKQEIKTIIFSIVFFILAMFCHESAMALPFYATAILLCRRISIKTILKQTWPLWFTLAVYFLFRLSSASLSTSILQNYAKYDMSFVEYLATLVYLYSWYLGKLIYPVGIILIKAHEIIRVGVAGWLLMGTLIIAGMISLMRIYRDQVIVVIGVTFMVVGAIPFCFASLFRPWHGMMVEPHWFAFPVIGIFILIATMILNIAKQRRVLAWILSIVITLSWMGASWGMNKIWAKEIAYCHYWLKESPGFSAPMFYLAKAYELRKQYAQARIWYERALVKNYQPYGVLTNLGLIDLMEGKNELAKKHFEQALEINPGMANTISNLGTIAFIQKDYIKAREYFEKAIAVDRFSALPRLNLARVLEEANDMYGAIHMYQSILAIVPAHEIALTHLVKLYWKQKDKDNVLKMTHRLAQVARNPETMCNIGIIHEYYGLNNEALNYYHIATRIDQGYAKAVVLYHRLLEQK